MHTNWQIYDNISLSEESIIYFLYNLTSIKTKTIIVISHTIIIEKFSSFKWNTEYDYFYMYYFVFFITPSTLSIILWWVVGRAEETNTYSWSRFCTVNCWPTTSSYQLFHMRLGRALNSELRGENTIQHGPQVTSTYNHQYTSALMERKFLGSAVLSPGSIFLECQESALILICKQIGEKRHKNKKGGKLKMRPKDPILHTNLKICLWTHPDHTSSPPQF